MMTVRRYSIWACTVVLLQSAAGCVAPVGPGDELDTNSIGDTADSADECQSEARVELSMQGGPYWQDISQSGEDLVGTFDIIDEDFGEPTIVVSLEANRGFATSIGLEYQCRPEGSISPSHTYWGKLEVVDHAGRFTLVSSTNGRYEMSPMEDGDWAEIKISCPPSLEHLSATTDSGHLIVYSYPTQFSSCSE